MNLFQKEIGAFTQSGRCNYFENFLEAKDLEPIDRRTVDNRRYLVVRVGNEHRALLKTTKRWAERRRQEEKKLKRSGQGQVARS